MTEKENKKSINTLCPAMKGIHLLRGRWSLAIIHTLMNGTKRFKELEREVTGISTRMLVKELKALENEKVITRKAYATVPPTVEYTLTEKGGALNKVIEEIGLWADQYV